MIHYKIIIQTEKDKDDYYIKISNCIKLIHYKIIIQTEKTKISKARIPERSKGTDLRSVALASWVRIPLRASKGNGKSPVKRPPPDNWGEKL